MGLQKVPDFPSTLPSLAAYLESMGKDIASFDLPGFPSTCVHRQPVQINAIADELVVLSSSRSSPLLNVRL